LKNTSAQWDADTRHNAPQAQIQEFNPTAQSKDTLLYYIRYIFLIFIAQHIFVLALAFVSLCTIYSTAFEIRKVFVFVFVLFFNFLFIAFVEFVVCQLQFTVVAFVFAPFCCMLPLPLLAPPNNLPSIPSAPPALYTVNSCAAEQNLLARA